MQTFLVFVVLAAVGVLVGIGTHFLVGYPRDFAEFNSGLGMFTAGFFSYALYRRAVPPTP